MKQSNQSALDDSVSLLDAFRAHALIMFFVPEDAQALVVGKKDTAKPIGVVREAQR